MAGMTRHQRSGLPRVSPWRGGSFARALPGGGPAGAATAAHGGPGTGRSRFARRNGPVSRDASRTRPRASCHERPSPSERSQVTGRNDAAHCPGRLLRPQRCFASRCAGRACGAPLTLETSADPAGLTARAKPKARPDMRAANLYTGRTAGIQGVTDCPHGRK
jgi:hypothetical protein